MLLFNASMARLFLASRTFITWNQSLTFCGHLHLNWITHLCHNKIVFAKLVLDSAHIICDLQRYVSAQLHYLLRWWDTGIRCVPLYDHANWSNGSYHLTIPFAFITVRIYPLGKLLKFLTLSNITVAWEIRIDVSLVEPKFPACPWIETHRQFPTHPVASKFAIVRLFLPTQIGIHHGWCERVHSKTGWINWCTFLRSLMWRDGGLATLACTPDRAV